MSDDFALGKRLWDRLDKRASSNTETRRRNLEAKNKITDVIIPAVSRGTKVNQTVLAAIREIYTVIEDGDEEQSQTLIELQSVRDTLEITINMLEQAGLDITNIQTIARNDEIWLGDHLATIKRALTVFNLQKLEVALDELDTERFEDIAHTVRRSGQKRNVRLDLPTLSKDDIK